MAKKKPLKKDRKAGNRPANAGPKKPFYQEIGAKRPQKKKPHPFGKGWELAEDFDRLEEGEYAVRCTALDEDGNGIVQIEGVSPPPRAAARRRQRTPKPSKWCSATASTTRTPNITSAS